jgi:hypothetical protein
MSPRWIVALIVGGVVLVAAMGFVTAPDLDRLRKDFEEQIPGVEFEKEVTLSLGPIALFAVKSVLKAAGVENEVSDYLGGLRRVRLAVYESRNLPPKFDVRFPKSLRQRLERGDWHLVVKVREAGDAAWVFCRQKGDSVDGIYVVALDENELVLVRADGRLERALMKAIHDNARTGDRSYASIRTVVDR